MISTPGTTIPGPGRDDFDPESSSLEPLPEELRSWVDRFRDEHGRPPRVLHIGNIANNAYRNAKLLRRHGVESDVLCYDYYHIMACPEWDEAELEVSVPDHDFPDWKSLPLGGYRRPRWFVQGPLAEAVEYLSRWRSGDEEGAESAWRRLAVHNRSAEPPPPPAPVRDEGGVTPDVEPADSARPSLWSRTASRTMTRVMTRGHSLLRRGLRRVPGARRVWHGLKRRRAARRVSAPGEPSLLSRLEARLESRFGGSGPKITMRDLEGFLGAIPSLVELFSHYDLVQGYATDGVWPLLCDRPYVAYEHGTIRHIPFQDTTQGRLCAVTYRMADGVCITNADNIDAARRLGLQRYRFVPHPIQEDALEAERGPSLLLRSELRSRLGSDFIVFHPARQHWEERRHPDWEKGNDILIRGLARFIHEVEPTAAAVFVEWGKTVEASKTLLAELGIADRVLWIPPLATRRFTRTVLACDVLADQFYLGSFGSTLPLALACSGPALLYLDHAVHEWCLPEPPPVWSARSGEAVFAALERMRRDTVETERLVAAGRAWYDRYHSNRRIAGDLVALYRDVLERRRESRGVPSAGPR